MPLNLVVSVLDCFTYIINMYLFDMTNGIPHVASSIQFTSEKTRDPDQLEVGRMTTGSDGSLDP